MARIFVTNNLHGRLREFKHLLKEVEFDFDEDVLVVLGNFLNKGPHQLELVDYLMEIDKISKNIHILYGKSEQMYMDALLNEDFIAEQKITREEKNVFYDYLDKKELREKHINYFVRLKGKTELLLNKEAYLFTTEDEFIDEKTCIYASDSKIDDFVVDSEKVVGVAFNKHVGLLELSNRECFIISKDVLGCI